jgi:ribosomal protein S1
MNTEETTPQSEAPAPEPQHEPHHQPEAAPSSPSAVSAVSAEPAGPAEPAHSAAAHVEGSPPETPAVEEAQPPPQAAASSTGGPPRSPGNQRREDYEEEPGDDIGNRVPGARLPDDIGNRRRGGGGPGPGPQRGGQHGGGRDAGAAPRPPRPQHDRPAAPAAAVPAAGLPVAAAAADAAAHEAGAPEGAAATVTAEGAPAPAEGVGPTGGPTGKKRRRRRRRKGGAEGAHAPGEAAAGGEAHEAGAEGEEHEGEEGAEGEEHEAGAEGEEGEEHEGGDPQAPGAEGEAPKRRRAPRGGPAHDRDRPAFSIGEEVFGKVSRVTDTAVWIDIAGKATGLFDRRELTDEEPPVEGDQFIATVASTGVRGGMLMLSRLSVILDESRKTLEAAVQSGEPVNGFVTGAVKGGLEIDLGGLRAFAPASHVDVHHGADLSYLVGQRLDFIVTQYAKKGRDIVVSRRKMLDEEHRKLRTEALSKVEPGSVHKGIVRKVVAWGAFIALPDAGGVEGLVHMTEASHDRGARLHDLFKPGAEVEVKVLNIDDKGKLWLSRKAVVADPWDAVKEKYAVGTRHKGKVARLQPFGAFIELESGIDGLIHTGDLSIKPIEHPQEVVKVGDEIEVIVASCDPSSHKIGLHPAPPPGEELETRQRVQPHKIVKVAVAQITEGGLVVRVLGVTGRSARGFIPAGHTGTPRGADLRKDFPIGMQVDAKVLEIDPRRGEAKLSIRAVKEDAEKQAYAQYRAGVAREAKFGTFADLMKKSS